MPDSFRYFFSFGNRKENTMTCKTWFSETIGRNMKSMGKEKSRAAVIAISARDVVKDHPECASELSRPKERVALTPRYYIVLSSASFRLYRHRPSVLRVFFLKKQPEDRQWKSKLRSVLKNKIGIAPSLGPLFATGDNYLEFRIESPAFWYNVLHHRYATFLD